MHTVDKTQQKCAADTNRTWKIYISPEKFKALKKLFHKSSFLSHHGLAVSWHKSLQCPLGILALIRGGGTQPASSFNWLMRAVQGMWVYEAGQQPEALCLCSRDMRLKVRAHEPHWYFFTSEWVCRWARRLERSAKARLQCWHAKGRSPEKKKETKKKKNC